MANMEKIKAIQERLRKQATSKRKGMFNISIYDKRDKSTHGKYNIPKEPNVEFTMDTRGCEILCREIKDYTKTEGGQMIKYEYVVKNIGGFKEVVMGPEDSYAMECLFRWGNRLTPGEFAKQEFPKTTPAFDMVVDMWHDLLNQGGRETFAKAKDVVQAKSQQVDIANLQRTQGMSITK